MKIMTLTMAILWLLASMASAGDYIRINADSIPAGAVAFKLEFFVERTCPEAPNGILSISNGFVLDATGTVEFQFAGFEWGGHMYEWFETKSVQKGLLFMNGLPTTWGSDGQFLAGAAIMPPFPGLPILETEHKYFDLYLDVRGEGEILIDSSFVFTYGYWKWIGLACGLGGAPDRPLFIAKDGSDLNHPIHITVFEPPCGDANLDGAVDVDDVIHIGLHIFAGGPAPNPWQVADPNCSGQIDIDDVVYLLNYIFGKSTEPCDPDGDGVPDC